MKAKNVTVDEMEKALMKVNQKYDDNIIFNRFDAEKTITFTLKCKDSKKAGHRIHNTYFYDGEVKSKRGISACWHVHGDFFDALIGINEDAVITSSFAKIDKNGGNWQDS